MAESGRRRGRRSRRSSQEGGEALGPHIHSEGYPYLLQNFSNNTHACRTSEVSTFRHVLNCLHCLMRQKHKLVYVYEDFPRSFHQKALILAGPGCPRPHLALQSAASSLPGAMCDQVSVHRHPHRVHSGVDSSQALFRRHRVSVVPRPQPLE